MAYVSAEGDQTARGDESDDSPAATASGAEIRPGETRAIRTVESHYTSGEDGSDGEKVWVMAVRSRGQVGMIGQTAKVRRNIA